ncbi:MAG TPA: ABC transporter permease [Candidatus Tectomicrobia bacterium]|nr:ABC transporter permease [Candidatus Tectomicrobia bacterium]
MVTMFRELFAYRVLIQTLVARDLKARYRGSAVGLLWTLLNPLFHMAIYALVFSVYAKVAMERYAAFLLCGLLPWIWLSSSLLMGATSIMEGGSLLKKVFFPPQVLPVVTVTANFVNFLASIPLLFILLLLFEVWPGWALLSLPLIMASQFALTLGLSLLVSGASVRYRDIPPILGHFLTFWFFLSPILYPTTQVPERFHFLLSLNPFTPFVVAYQNVFLYNKYPSWQAIGAMIIAGAIALLVGVLVFGRFRWSFAEEV